MLLGAILGRALVATAQTFSIIDITATADSDYKYTGAAAVGTNVYFAPENEHNVGVLDTTTNTFSTIDISSFSNASVKYWGAAAVGTSVYFAPLNENNMGVLDTTTSAFSIIDIASFSTGTFKYSGAAAVGTSVFFAPLNEDNIGVLDTTTSAFSIVATTDGCVDPTLGPCVDGDSKYMGAAAVGTSVYFAPLNEDNIGVLDTTTSAFSIVATTDGCVDPTLGPCVDGDNKYMDAAAVGTSVFFAPRDANNVGVLDTTTDTFSTIDISSFSTAADKYMGAVAVGTNVIFTPLNADNVGVLDTTTSTFSTIDTIATGVNADNKYACAAAVGTSVFAAPRNEDNVGVLAPPSSPSSAGDDPTFVGADGLPYEVRGEPWKYFNLLSTPRLSLNAQFLPVPERFVHGKITDTVLGTLHLALCDAPRSRIVGVTFDVFNGAIGCTVRSPDEAPGSSEQAPCANVLPLAGVAVTAEPSACNLATMECGYVPLEHNLTAILEVNPALVRVHMVRYNVSVFGTNLSLVRDVVDRPEPNEELDCSVLAAISGGRALRACEVWLAVVRGVAPLSAWLALPEADRIGTMARLTAGNKTRQLHFYNALVEAVPYAQRDVHGLLGQRSVSPAPMRASALGPSPLGPLALSTAQLREASAGGSSAGTLQIAIGADGQHQGEGAIEGSYRDYQVRYVSSHGPDAHMHSRFVCGAGAL